MKIAYMQDDKYIAPMNWQAHLSLSLNHYNINKILGKKVALVLNNGYENGHSECIFYLRYERNYNYFIMTIIRG